MNLFLLKKSNKLLIILFFLIILIYFTTYAEISSKAKLLSLGRNQDLKMFYGMWGYINDNLFQFFSFHFGKETTEIFIVQFILAVQVALIWSLTIYKILNQLNFLAILIFFHPFILNFFTLCTRDSIALGILFLITFKSWNKFKFITSLFISIFIHKGILPLIFISSIISKNQKRSKKYFLIITLISILIAIALFFLLRYTDIINILPESPYKAVLSYPRIAFTSNGDISDYVKRAYNFYGNFNFKILFFGIFGQILAIFFKDYFPKNSFSLSFSVFFICTSLSSIPNADRFIYHAVLIAFPFLIFFSISFFNKTYKKLISY